MEKQFLSFRLVSEWYVVDVTSILEIINYIEPVPVPGAPQEIQGILNIRGKIVPIISAYHFFSLSAPSSAADQKIIIFETTSIIFGIVVDELNEILSLDTDKIEYTSETQHNPNIVGTISHQHSILILVDFSSVDRK